MVNIKGYDIKNKFYFTKLINRGNIKEHDVFNLSNNDLSNLSSILDIDDRFDDYYTKEIISKLYFETNFINRSNRKKVLEMINFDADDFDNLDFDRIFKYFEYRETNKYDSSSDDYLKLKFGNKWEIEKGKVKKRRNNPYWSIKYWTSRGHSIEEAEYKVSEYQKNNSGVSKKYHINKYGEEEGLNKWNTINKSKGKTLSELVDLYGYDKAMEKHRIRIEKLSKSANWIVGTEADDFIFYKKIVNRYTKINLSLYGEYKFGKGYEDKIGRKTYHIDHNISKKDGFLNNIPPYIIGNINNLRLIDYLTNLKKSIKSDITLDKLMENIENCKLKEKLNNKDEN